MFFSVNNHEAILKKLTISECSNIWSDIKRPINSEMRKSHIDSLKIHAISSKFDGQGHAEKLNFIIRYIYKELPTVLLEFAKFIKS